MYYSAITRDFQITDWQNPQDGEINLVVQSSSGCSYLVKDGERIRTNPKIAFSYIANYEKRARPECAPDWKHAAMITRDPKNGYDANEVVLLSPYPKFEETEVFTIVAFAVPAGLFAIGAALGWVMAGFKT